MEKNFYKKTNLIEQLLTEPILSIIEDLNDEDLNDGRDAAMYLRLENFTLLETVDLFDSQGEIYFCVNVNNQSYGCLPSVLNSYEEVQVGETLRLTHSYHITQFISHNSQVRPTHSYHMTQFT